IGNDCAGHAGKLSASLLAPCCVPVEDNDMRAFLEKAGSSSRTDSARTTGNENSLAFDAAHEGVRIQAGEGEEKPATVLGGRRSRTQVRQEPRQVWDSSHQLRDLRESFANSNGQKALTAKIANKSRQDRKAAAATWHRSCTTPFS